MKDKDKHLVGQPVFRQLINFIPGNQFDRLVEQHGSDRYYKTFPSRTQIVSMLFGIQSRCDSSGELLTGSGLWKES